MVMPLYANGPIFGPSLWNYIAEFKHIITSRFGEQAMVYDPTEIGSNREASSKDFTVVSDGSLSSGE
jgi:hypothetical protein